MLQHLHHHFRLALPVMAVIAAVVFMLSLSRLAMDVTAGQPTPSSHSVQTIGDGLDEFTLLTGASMEALSGGVVRYGVWIVAIALITTTIMVLSAVKLLSLWVNGPSDIGALVRHALVRARRCVGVSHIPVAWGVVRDEHSGQPLPLATVSLLDGHGSVMASAVADTQGRYGFHAPAHYAHAVGGLLVHKEGYFLSSTRNLDVHMKKVHGTHDELQAPYRTTGTLERCAQGVSFWSGLVAVPLVYAAAPSPASALLVVLFGGAAIVRAIGTASQRTK